MASTKPPLESGGNDSLEAKESDVSVKRTEEAPSSNLMTDCWTQVD